LSCLAVPGRAATIPVTTTADDLTVNGNCTLREAVVAANTNSAVDGCPAGQPRSVAVDLITLPAGTYTLTVGPAGDDGATNGDLDLTDSVEIRGAGARVTTVQAGRLDRLFDVDPAESGIAARLTDLRLRDGDAGSGQGGAIRNAGTLVLERTTVTGNFATGAGGAIRNNGVLEVYASTLSFNHTDDHGGGIDNHGSAVFENVTIVGNTVGTGAGGGVYVDGGQSLVLRSSTVTGNSAPTGPAINNFGTLSITNSLIEGTCAGEDLDTTGGNLESPGNTCGLDLAADRVGVADPLLDPLGDYGGPTDTRRPQPGSPAIDSGADGSCPATDQRLASRPRDGDGDQLARCDIGAHEAGEAGILFLDGFESGDTSGWSAAVP
jgi:CSLREA domain-containing protein